MNRTETMGIVMMKTRLMKAGMRIDMNRIEITNQG